VDGRWAQRCKGAVRATKTVACAALVRRVREHTNYPPWMEGGRNDGRAFVGATKTRACATLARRGGGGNRPYVFWSYLNIEACIVHLQITGLQITIAQGIEGYKIKY
jgi:hypothetical protein